MAEDEGLESKRTWIKDGKYQMVHWPDHPISPKSGDVPVHRVVLYDAIGPGAHECHWCGWEVSWDAPIYVTTDGKKRRNALRLEVDHLSGDRLNNDPDALAPTCSWCNAQRATLEQFELSPVLFADVSPIERPNRAQLVASIKGGELDELLEVAPSIDDDTAEDWEASARPPSTAVVAPNPVVVDVAGLVDGLADLLLSGVLSEEDCDALPARIRRRASIGGSAGPGRLAERALDGDDNARKLLMAALLDSDGRDAPGIAPVDEADEVDDVPSEPADSTPVAPSAERSITLPSGRVRTMPDADARGWDRLLDWDAILTGAAPIEECFHLGALPADDQYPWQKHTPGSETIEVVD